MVFWGSEKESKKTHSIRKRSNESKQNDVLCQKGVYRVLWALFYQIIYMSWFVWLQVWYSKYIKQDSKDLSIHGYSSLSPCSSVSIFILHFLYIIDPSYWLFFSGLGLWIFRTILIYKIGLNAGRVEGKFMTLST